MRTDPVPARPRRRTVPVGAIMAAVIAVAGGVIFAVTRPAPQPEPATSETVTPLPFDLLTHCGIDEAKIGDAYFEAGSPIIGPARSAPAGWDNPYQHGTMTLLAPTAAVFHDDRGHEVRFRVRAGATAFKQLCD